MISSIYQVNILGISKSKILYPIFKPAAKFFCVYILRDSILMKKLRIHYFQHAPFEGLGCIEEWAKDHVLSSTHFYAGDPVPELNDIDLLVIMGGPMGVYEEAKYPWLRDEKDCIRSVIEEGKKVLGVCLGAQLISGALGSRVYPNRHKEIGWFPVFPTALDHTRECLHNFLLEKPVVFHWHGDTFDLPEGAVNHAYSEACPHQMFTIGDHVIGIQFHFEVTESDVKEMVKEGAEELCPGKYVQSGQTILEGLHQASRPNRFMKELLTDFIQNGNTPPRL